MNFDPNETKQEGQEAGTTEASAENNAAEVTGSDNGSLKD